MFTGIIEDLGIIHTITRTTVAITTRLGDIHIGDSIAVNGVCLTVTRIAGGLGKNTLHFEYTPETFSRTTLATLTRGTQVNVERAVLATTRMGGHMVSGHVEALGTISLVRSEGNSHLFTITAPAELLRFVVPKGSIAVDGISLTVVDVTAASFSISVIPLTMKHTTLAFREKGDTVNLEADILARYQEKTQRTAVPTASKLSISYLKENGFS